MHFRKKKLIYSIANDFDRNPSASYSSCVSLFLYICIVVERLDGASSVEIDARISSQRFDDVEIEWRSRSQPSETGKFGVLLPLLVFTFFLSFAFLSITCYFENAAFKFARAHVKRHFLRRQQWSRFMFRLKNSLLSKVIYRVPRQFWKLRMINVILHMANLTWT